MIETIQGKILFDPIDLTKKHVSQSSWKKIVIALIEGDICEYYAWFIKKRYNIKLNSPLRGAHFTIINDIVSDLKKYNYINKNYNNKIINIKISDQIKTDGLHYWLICESEDAMKIRNKCNLSSIPYWGFHITIGIIAGREYEIEHANYIFSFFEKGLVIS